MILLPPKLTELTNGSQLHAGLGISTIIPTIDFETYSPAGFVWNPQLNKFTSLPGTTKKGLPVVGAAVYAEHPDAEVLCCAYDLKDGKGNRLWRPGMNPPADLLAYVFNGGLIQAFNARFEFWIWNKVCVPKYGWPMIHIEQMRCAAARSRAFGLPGSLDPVGEILNIKNKKLKDGTRLIRKFSIPRNPTLRNEKKRILPTLGDPDTQKLFDYNIRDIEAESEVSSLTPDLIPSELEFWFADQHINTRGVQLDVQMIAACKSILKSAYNKYNNELYKITGGAVTAASQVTKLIAWMITRGIHTRALDEETLDELLRSELPIDVRRALEIRALVGSAAVKKLNAMTYQCANDNRIHDMFIFHSARTGRSAGAGAQPQNMPNSGEDVAQCIDCKRHFNRTITICLWCGSNRKHEIVEWNANAVADALEVISTKSVECVEYYFGSAISTISGCLRGMFISAPGKDLICSDYSAIEAVVLAALAKEDWRLDVFRTHGKIYEMSASMITGMDFDEYLLFKATSGKHHPDRKIGKVAELASGYQGWLGAWKAFGADKFMSDEDIKNAVLAWRKASPNIVNFWGGQPSWKQPYYYGLEGAAIQAILNPGVEYSHNGIIYIVKQNVLYCKLLSGRTLVYHRPLISTSKKRSDASAISFEGWNTNPKQGAIGWIRMDTYGGKLTENVVQATARDLLAHAIVNLEKNNYPVVLHVHDEIVSEIPENFGSVTEFEGIMSTMPSWAKDWPIRASGGWRAKRYGK